MVQRIFPALRRGVTLGNVACNLSRNGELKLQDFKRSLDSVKQNCGPNQFQDGQP